MNAVLRHVSPWAAVLALVLLVAPPRAAAHAMPTSAVELDVGAHAVSGELRLPLDRLAVAIGRPLTAAQAGGALRMSLERYSAAHIRAVGDDGRPWTVEVSRAHAERGSPTDDLIETLRLAPPAGRVTGFTLHYDVILAELVTHRAIVTVRNECKTGTTSRAPRTVGVLDWTRTAIRVEAGTAVAMGGAASSASCTSSPPSPSGTRPRWRWRPSGSSTRRAGWSRA